MPIRLLALLAALAALGLFAVSAASASTSIAVRTDPGGALLSGSTTITSTAAHTTFTYDDFSMSSCHAGSADFDLTQSTNASSITGTLTRLNLGCVPSGTSPCALDTGPLPVVNVSTYSPDSRALVAINDLTLRCPTTTIFGVATQCYYTAPTALGLATNVPSRLTFEDIAITNIPRSDSVAAACHSVALFSLTLTGLVQGGTNRTVTFKTS
jgi:hypothetical protein